MIVVFSTGIATFYVHKLRVKFLQQILILKKVLAGGNDDEFIVFKIQPSATEDYIMDDNQIAKPKPGKVAKV